jgi:copper transport protein
VCIALLIATGSYQALTQIDSLAEVGATTYGRLLVTKVSVFAALIGVAAISRAWVRRRYHSKLSADVAHSGERPPGDVRRLRRSVGVEAGLATAVLAVTAILVVTQPARTAYHPTTSATLTAGPATVQISAVPTGNRTIQLHAYTYDHGGSPLAVPEMTAALFLPTRGIGPLDLHLRAAGPGHFVTNDVSVPIAGAWQLQLQVRTSDIDSYPAATSVTIR